MFNADFVTNLNALLMTVKESYDDLWEQNGENDLFNNKLLHLIQRLEPGYQPDASILSAIETTLFEEKDNKYETTDDTAFDDAEIAERVLTSIEILNLLCSNTETEKYYREYLDSGYPDRISPDTVQTAMNIKINRFRASQEIEQENNFESIAEHIVEELGKRQKNFFYWKKEWDKSIGERRNAGELHINYPRAKRAWHDYRTNVLCLLKQLRTSVSFFYLDEYEAFIQQIHAGYCKTVLELCHLNEELDENDYSNSILGTLNDAATIEDSPAWKIYNAYAAFELLEPWMFLETKPEDNEEEIICQLFYEAKINAITAKLKQDLKVYLDERKNNWLYKPQDLKNSGEHNSLEQRKNSVNALTKIEKLWENKGNLRNLLKSYNLPRNSVFRRITTMAVEKYFIASLSRYRDEIPLDDNIHASMRSITQVVHKDMLALLPNTAFQMGTAESYIKAKAQSKQGDSLLTGMKKLWLRFRLVFPLGKEKLLEDNAHEQRYVETIKGYLKETEANWFLYFQSELEKMDEPDDGACIDPLLRSINVTNAISPKAIMASYVHIITLLGQAYRNSADLAIRKQFRTLQSSIMRNYLTLSHDKYGDNKFTLSDGQVLEVTAALQEAENFKGNLSISESFRNRIRPAMGNRAYKNSILQYKLPARANFSISDFAIQGNDIEARKNQAVRLLSSKINDLLYANKVLASGLVGSTEKAAASSNAKMLGGVIGGYLGDAAEYAYKTIQNDKINGVIQQGSNNAGVSAKDMQALSLRVASRLVECYQWLFTEIAADDVSFVLKKILPQISKSIRKGSLGNLSLTDKITYITNDVLSMHMSNQGFLGLTKRELRGHDNRDSDITIEGAVCYPTYVVVDVKNSKNEDFYSYTCYTRGNDPEPDNGYVLLTSAEFNTLKMHESGGAQMFRKLNEECYKENHTSKNLDNLDDNHILKQIENKMHGNNVHELIEDFARKKNKETKELKKIKILEPVNMEVNGSELDITLAAQRENMDSGIKLFALLPDQKTCDNVFEDDSQKKTTTNFSTPQKRNN